MSCTFRAIITPPPALAAPAARNGLRADCYAGNNNVATTIDFDD
jgi:hypothetical protein